MNLPNAAAELSLPRASVNGVATAADHAGSPESPELVREGVVQPRAVVAVVLTWRGRVGLFKRSSLVSGDAGLWHCITGYLEAGNTPFTQALMELREETGLALGELLDVQEHESVELTDSSGGRWHVHVFRAETTRRRLQLNWEHVGYRWVTPSAVRRFDGQVSWLRQALDADAIVPATDLAGTAHGAAAVESARVSPPEASPMEDAQDSLAARNPLAEVVAASR